MLGNAIAGGKGPSENFLRIFGFEEQRSYKQEEFQALVHPDDFEEVMAVFARCLETGENFDHEYRCVHRVSGTTIHVLSRSKILNDEAGKPIRILGMKQDITEQKEVDRRYRLLADNATDLVCLHEPGGRFTYVASHDLQEPLRMVSSCLQVLERDYREHFDADGKEFIGYAVEGAQRMKRLINDLLMYSRVGTHNHSAGLTDANAFLDGALLNLRLSIEEADATIEKEHLPAVVVDESQLLQVFQNLIGNALKFRVQEAPLVRVAVSESAEFWVFSVTDNGIGIDPEHADRIFKIFQRLHPRNEYPGTGVELAVCRRIVETHGGHIWVESGASAGSTFFFTLPKLVAGVVP